MLCQKTWTYEESFIQISIHSPIQAFESAMIAIVDLLRQQNSNQPMSLEMEHNQMILLHYVAALGLVNLFDDLLDWK